VPPYTMIAGSNRAAVCTMLYSNLRCVSFNSTSLLRVSTGIGDVFFALTGEETSGEQREEISVSLIYDLYQMGLDGYNWIYEQDMLS